MSKNTTSTITLKMYVDLLRRSSIGGFSYVEQLDETEKRATKELIDSGLISDSTRQVGSSGIRIMGTLVITPEGASALESWSSYLQQNNKWQKLGDALLRLCWLLIGALAASLSQIIERIFT